MTWEVEKVSGRLIEKGLTPAVDVTLFGEYSSVTVTSTHTHYWLRYLSYQSWDASLVRMLFQHDLILRQVLPI